MASTDIAERDRAPQLFGHPRGLTFLFGTEMWERFSYYGNRVLLPIFLTGYLLQPAHADQVIGYQAIKHFFEWFRGSLAVQPLESMIYAVYTALVYFTPLIGGYLADRWFGRRYTVVIGGLLMAVGQFLMTSDQLFFIALTFMIVGNGAFKPNISTQVGGLYKPGDHRIDRAYSIFYVGINVGSLLGQSICGPLGEKVNWHYGFAAAGVGMLIGTITYLFAMRTLPSDRVVRDKTATATVKAPRKPFSGDDWRAMGMLILLFIPCCLFWATYEQSGNVIEIWSRDYVDRMVHLGSWSFEIPVTTLQNVNPFFIFTFTPIVLMLWGNQQKKGREPSVIVKMALGCLLISLSYLLLAGVMYWAGPTGKVFWPWAIAYFALLTAGELYFSPVGLSLYAKAAPVQIGGFMMAVFLATSSPGNLLAGILGSYWSDMNKVTFFLMIAAIIGVAVPVIFAFKGPIERVLARRREQERLERLDDPTLQPHMEPPPG
ncbi:MAG TPA: peptide MFS transporter [Rhizomicrobium sp.]|jgi:POT family proton-dependent oligopeptide transporter|nr:peptide MFS transporter [Acidisoma sp.]